ncbi:hypothetical protein M0R19_06200 [Candidatus Pacearchaeota archaeon]|jgi:hypothetical protein|nr:hypothetical protein [Candidatus Pacearchaeota archaeon]
MTSKKSCNIYSIAHPKLCKECENAIIETEDTPINIKKIDHKLHNKQRKLYLEKYYFEEENYNKSMR